jgi:hypothetical protein
MRAHLACQEALLTFIAFSSCRNLTVGTLPFYLLVNNPGSGVRHRPKGLRSTPRICPRSSAPKPTYGAFPPYPQHLIEHQRLATCASLSERATPCFSTLRSHRAIQSSAPTQNTLNLIGRKTRTCLCSTARTGLWCGKLSPLDWSRNYCWQNWRT